MDMERMIAMYMDECMSRQLRPKTMQSYEQTLRLFAAWLKESEKIERIEDIQDRTMRDLLIMLDSGTGLGETLSIEVRDRCG